MTNESQEPDLRLEQELVIETFHRSAYALIDGLIQLQGQTLNYLTALSVTTDEENEADDGES